MEGTEGIERRPEGRGADALRPWRVEAGVQRNALGSVLIAAGHTRVLCAATVADGVPGWMRDRAHERGWLTAEYAMLPGSGDRRVRRQGSSRWVEIERLIGRSLRAAVDLEALAGLTITVDCDVLDADGGTRTAAITGGWIATALACRRLLEDGRVGRWPVVRAVAAVSVGIVGGRALLDLDYPEDAAASVDMNVVGVPGGGLVEVQGTAEGEPFSRAELSKLLDLATVGIERLGRLQQEALGGT